MLYGPPKFNRIWRHCMPMHNKMTLVHWPLTMTSSCVTLKLFLPFVLFQFHVLDENWEIIGPFFNIIYIATIQNRRFVWRCAKRWLITKFSSLVYYGPVSILVCRVSKVLKETKTKPTKGGPLSQGVSALCNQPTSIHVNELPIHYSHTDRPWGACNVYLLWILKLQIQSSKTPRSALRITLQNFSNFLFRFQESFGPEIGYPPTNE
jgi:hypothetical protein